MLWQRAVSILDDMLAASDERGVAPDAHCFNGAINACAKVRSGQAKLFSCMSGAQHGGETRRVFYQATLFSRCFTKCINVEAVLPIWRFKVMGVDFCFLRGGGLIVLCLL